MCSFFWQRMERDQGGDLGDIIRASSACGGAPGTSHSHQAFASDWQFPSSSDPASFPPPMEGPSDGFGDPFSNLRDPLLHELAGPSSSLFDSPDSMAGLGRMGTKCGDDPLIGGGDGGSGTCTLLTGQKILGEEMSRPCNLFSRALQISPAAKATAAPGVVRGIRPAPILVGDMMKMNNNSPVCCQSDHGGLQISSPRTPGIKRRKSQAKKVVCIPAPAAAGSRPSGEVVPSDLWAWRKYGQKPIKGSPYPRGYYRCSSSKGCSARKQVERSRTDPNMLVITYTSEHNHPWPTQRNALAGSTRTQPTRNSSSSAPKNSPQSQLPAAGGQDEHKEMGSISGPVKEETAEMEKPADAADNHDLDLVFHRSYKPMFLGSGQSDDFFAGLGELDPDPMDLVFTKGFLGDKTDEERENKGMDPFDIYDWAAGNTLDETKKGGL